MASPEALEVYEDEETRELRRNTMRVLRTFNCAEVLQLIELYFTKESTKESSVYREFERLNINGEQLLRLDPDTLQLPPDAIQRVKVYMYDELLIPEP